MNKIHVANPEFNTTLNKTTVNIAGIGGTGSHMLGSLAAINSTLKALNMTQIMVNAFDPDVVTSANIGRQLFAKSEIGMNKAVAMITRINRYFGTNWRAYPCSYPDGIEGVNPGRTGANLIITCVDRIEARFAIRDAFPNNKESSDAHSVVSRPLYWLDIGNSRYTGQVILGSMRPSVSRKKNHVRMLPTFAELFPELKGKRDPSSPSCSTFESIQKQDLFINKLLATLASDLLWQLFFKREIDRQGYFVNMKTGKMNPIAIK